MCPQYQKQHKSAEVCKSAGQTCMDSWIFLQSSWQEKPQKKWMLGTFLAPPQHVWKFSEQQCMCESGLVSHVAHKSGQISLKSGRDHDLVLFCRWSLCHLLNHHCFLCQPPMSYFVFLQRKKGYVICRVKLLTGCYRYSRSKYLHEMSWTFSLATVWRHDAQISSVNTLLVSSECSQQRVLLWSHTLQYARLCVSST